MTFCLSGNLHADILSSNAMNDVVRTNSADRETFSHLSSLTGHHFATFFQCSDDVWCS